MHDFRFRRQETSAPALPRRQFLLRGLGAALAVPAWQSLQRTTLGAAAGAPPLATTPGGAPLRMAYVYFPNGAIPAMWAPTRAENDWSLSPTLADLAPWKHKLQVLAGLDQRNAQGGPDGAGDHARGGSVFLTGVRLRKSATDVRAGQSVDQAVAQRLGQAARIPSLELTCDQVRKSGTCDSGYSCAYVFNMSWHDATTPMTPEPNPRLAFERLFGAGSPEERARSLAQRRARQRSILDYLADDAKSLHGRLDRGDRAKLDQYLTGVRELERRIEQEERFSATLDPAVEAPAGIPREFAGHVDLMLDVLALAFQTDSTRVATMLMSHDGSNRPFHDIGISEGHHDLSHHQNRPERVQKVAEIDHWYARRFAGLLERLDAIPDVDGRTVLDNSMIVYGSGNADGNAHTHVNLPIVLAGGGGGTLAPGRFVDHGGQPLCNLFLSLADRMGVDLPRFGDSTGRLGNL
ncbi:MAG: DUF1552 domain-containing protein [Pirellulales bacterium]|nr:DUF1552 domain-containing protein [Pirellulales bacterium]